MVGGISATLMVLLFGLVAATADDDDGINNDDGAIGEFGISPISRIAS